MTTISNCFLAQHSNVKNSDMDVAAGTKQPPYPTCHIISDPEKTNAWFCMNRMHDFVWMQSSEARTFSLWCPAETVFIPSWLHVCLCMCKWLMLYASWQLNHCCRSHVTSRDAGETRSHSDLDRRLCHCSTAVRWELSIRRQCLDSGEPVEYWPMTILPIKSLLLFTLCP